MEKVFLAILMVAVLVTLLLLVGCDKQGLKQPKRPLWPFHQVEVMR